MFKKSRLLRCQPIVIELSENVPLYKNLLVDSLGKNKVVYEHRTHNFNYHDFE